MKCFIHPSPRLPSHVKVDSGTLIPYVGGRPPPGEAHFWRCDDWRSSPRPPGGVEFRRNRGGKTDGFFQNALVAQKTYDSIMGFEYIYIYYIYIIYTKLLWFSGVLLVLVVVAWKEIQVHGVCILFYEPFWRSKSTAPEHVPPLHLSMEMQVIISEMSGATCKPLMRKGVIGSCCCYKYLLQPMVVGWCLLFVVCRFLLVACCLLVVVCCLLLVVCWLLVVSCSLIVVCSVLFVVC